MPTQVLQQHCDFFDTDRDGVIWPIDTFVGFYKLGYGIILSTLSVVIIHSNFSYPTLSGIIPDPMFRIYVANIYKDKHGSDTGTYDNEGRFLPQKFEDIFSKYGQGKDKDRLSFWDAMNVMKGQRLIADPIGWFGAFFECNLHLTWHVDSSSTLSVTADHLCVGVATYILLWPEDGQMRKDDIRRVYDGSISYTVAERRAAKKSH